MDKRQVLMVSLQPLLGEGLGKLFQKWEDVELVSLESADWREIDARIGQLNPGMVLIAGEKEDDAVTHLISNLLKRCADIPILWIELETNILRLYTSHLMPASSTGLIDAIRQSGIHQMEIYPREEKKARPVRKRR